MSFKPRVWNSTEVQVRKRTPRRKVKVVSNLEMPDALLGWERELLVSPTNQALAKLQRDQYPKKEEATEEPPTAARRPLLAHFTIQEGGDSHIVLEYNDGSKGPMPPNKKLGDLLPAETRQRFAEVLADLVLKDLFADPSRQLQDIGPPSSSNGPPTEGRE